MAELQKLFLAAWAAQNGPALVPRDWFPVPELPGHQLVRAIGSSPEEPFSAIHATLMSAIAHARTSIQITVAYFAPDAPLQVALQDAAARGVAVTLILPGQTDSWLVFHAGRARYAALLQAGVRIVERQDAILHAKTALIDGVWVTVGSTNLDWRSYVHNHELKMCIRDRVMTQELLASLLGVRRESITQAAGRLQELGHIRYRRGHITVLDAAGLRATACECYGVVKAEMRRLAPAGMLVR